MSGSDAFWMVLGVGVLSHWAEILQNALGFSWVFVRSQLAWYCLGIPRVDLDQMNCQEEEILGIFAWNAATMSQLWIRGRMVLRVGSSTTEDVKVLFMSDED